MILLLAGSDCPVSCDTKTEDHDPFCVVFCVYRIYSMAIITSQLIEYIWTKNKLTSELSNLNTPTQSWYIYVYIYN